MDTAHNTYTFGMATGEIVSLLLLTFLVGMLLCWLLRQAGLCCRTRKPATSLPNSKYHTRDFDINTSNATAKLAVPDVYVPKVKVQPRIVDLPDIDLQKPSIDTDLHIPSTKLPAADLTLPEVEVKLPELPEVAVTLPEVEVELPELPEVAVTLPEVELPKAELSLPEVALPEAELYIPEIQQPEWIAAIDPHKPIIDPPDLMLDTHMDLLLDTDLELPTMQTHSLSSTALNSIELPEIDPLLAAIDPHKPIIDPPDMPHDMEWAIPLGAPTMQIETPSVDLEAQKYDPLLAAIDPHKPIIDPPDMPEETQPTTTGHLFNSWLHKAKESVEHLTEKATPATSEWLHKAKESVEHLTEKATPATTDWLHKAKESVEHLTEKATPATSEWLHKAKEIGNEISAKSSSLTSAETLAKGGSTLAALAASAKELTEKLTSNLSIKHDDLQKLTGIGPTFASVLHRAGIHTYAQLSETSPQKLQALLIVEDEQFSKHDTSSWPRQAALAAYGEWEQLKAYQDTLSP